MMKYLFIFVLLLIEGGLFYAPKAVSKNFQRKIGQKNKSSLKGWLAELQLKNDEIDDLMKQGASEEDIFRAEKDRDNVERTYKIKKRKASKNKKRRI